MMVIKSLLMPLLALLLTLISTVDAYPFLPSQSSFADLLNRAATSSANLTTPSLDAKPELNPSEILTQAREGGHVVNLLEYTRALTRKYGKPQSGQTQGGTAPPHTSEQLNQRAAKQQDAGKDSDLSSSLSFSTEQAKVYEVGNHIPFFGFPTKTSWAGIIPIDPKSNLTAAYLTDLPKQAGESNSTIAKAAPRSLFFWLWGSEGETASRDDLIIWLQGGPGCSSMFGFLQENGPVRWTNQSLPATPANNSWTQVADIIYVDQPVGTGFSIGQPTAVNETDVARDFYNWWGNVLTIFPELKRKKLWIAAESYGGLYGPYMSDYFYSQKDKYNLQGLLLMDGFITGYNLAQGATALDYSIARNETLQLPPNATALIKNATDVCGYTDYSAKNLLYPLDHHLPSAPEDKCDTFSTYVEAGFNSTRFFNVYDIRWKKDYDVSWDNPLGNANAIVPFDNTFLSNRTMQDYIHAPHLDWVLCSSSGLFINGTDTSEYPVYSVLPSAIEKAQNTIIAHGRYDGLLLQNGTAIALQNMTWGGSQGFSSPPTQVVNDEFGERVATFISERKLSFVIAEKAGHSIPGDDGPTGIALIRSLLGQRTLGGDGGHGHHNQSGEQGTASTQSGDQTGIEKEVPQTNDAGSGGAPI